jgi:hypothetical protein
VKEKSKLPKYYKYFLKNTMKKGIMYGAWSFFLNVSHQSGTDLDEMITPKVEFFSEWSYDEGEYIYYKTNKNQYYFIDDFCGDDMYTMGFVCKFLWYYWMLDMSIVVFYSLFLVDIASKFEFLNSWYTRVDGIKKLLE